jgi:hypothetical protein
MLQLAFAQFSFLADEVAPGTLALLAEFSQPQLAF